jgi:hypothetical protein
MITYEGDDKNGTPVYDVSIDLAQFSAIENTQQVYILKRSDASASWVCQSTTLSGSTVTASGVTGFSGFGAGGTGGALAIELLEFEAERVESLVELQWSTALEIDNSHFIVERSEDAVLFEEIGTVSGQGNSQERTDYEFTDFVPLNSGAYYRLTDVEFDGDVNHSEVVFVAGQVTVTINPVLYPNPTSGQAILSLSSSTTGTLSILDAAGRLILSQQVSREQRDIPIDLRESPAGLYQILFQHQDGIWRNTLIRKD